MPAIEWKDEYSVGDPTIDSQHKQLIATMNQLSSLLELPTPPIEESARIFGALAVYVLDHFTYEEQRMASMGYPASELAEHQATHVGFLRQIRDFQKRFNAGDPMALGDLLPFLQGTWLTEHIGQTDRLYMPFLSGR